MPGFSSVVVRGVLALTVLSALPAGAQTAPGGKTPSPSELKVFDPALIDASIDPCENFYRFSCNGWVKKNPLPPDQTSYGRFTELAELNRLHLKQILETAANAHPESRSANEQKIGDEYASCMNLEAINRAGITPLKPELDRIAAMKQKEQLPELLGHLHRVGVGAFFGLRSNSDFGDASQVISYYYAGGLGLPERDYYTRMDAKSADQRRLYVEHVKNMFVLAGEPEEQAAREADTVLALETRLAKASLTVTQQRDPQNLNHPGDVASFDKQLTHFWLARYDEAAHAPTSGKMNDEEPKFFAEFNAM